MNTKWIRLYRLLRPLFHFGIILSLFALTYKLRLFAEAIPGSHEIPVINVEELKIFALLSAVAFVGVGLIQNLYELHKTADNYIKTLSKVWLYWFIFIAFVSYFGQGLIF